MAIVTWANAIKYSNDELMKAILYGAQEQDQIFAALPFNPWLGGKSYKWNQVTTLPTSAWREVTDTLSSTAGTELERHGYLKEIYVQKQVPPRHEAPLENTGISQRAKNIYKMALSVGKELREAIFAGSSVSVAIGGTTPALHVGRVEASPNHPTGLGYLKFTNATNMLQYKAPGSSSYGTAVDISSVEDGLVLYDGDDASQYIIVDADQSSLTGGDRETSDAATGLTFTTSKKPDGLLSYVHGAQRTWGSLSDTPTATGDGASLTQLDWLLDQVVGGRNDLLFVTSPRTRRTLKGLLAGSSDTVEDWRGLALARGTLAYEGIPIYASTNMPTDRTAGTSSTGTGDASSAIILAKLARTDYEEGFSVFYWNEGGSQRIADPGMMEGSFMPPLYYRDLNEMETLTDHLLRITGCFAPVLANTQAAAMVDGIND